jgi:hypothetical protein
MVRAKFQVRSIERSKDWQGREVRTVVLVPVCEGSEENKQFWEATPSGEIKLGCANLEASSYFDLDQEFYVDFTRA